MSEPCKATKRPKHLDIEGALSTLAQAIEDLVDFRREITGEKSNDNDTASSRGETNLAETLDTLAPRLTELSDKLHMELEALNRALF